MKGNLEGQCEEGEDVILLLALKMEGPWVRNAVALVAGKGKKTQRNAALLTGDRKSVV